VTLPPLPDGLLKIIEERATGVGERLTDEAKVSLLQPKSAGERTDTMKRLVGHYVAIGETRATTKTVLTWWNERNLTPLPDEEFEYQFDSMWRRWAPPDEETPLEDAVRLAELYDGEVDKQEYLIGILDGRYLEAKEYAIWRERLKRDYKLDKKIFDTLVRPISSNSAKPDDSQAQVEVSGERRRAALKLLHSPALLYRCLQFLVRAGLVGEGANALLTLLAATSRLLEDAINILFLGEAASGKSFIMLITLRLIPPEEKIVVQRFSAQAIIYTPKTFKHKIVAILERSGAEEAGYNIRTIQSEKRVVVTVTAKDENGRFTAVDYVKEGPTAFISSTVNPLTDAQEETRLWKLYPDESEEQTERIMEAQEKEWHVPDEEYELFHDAQRLLSNIEIARPQLLLRTIGGLIRKKMAVKPIRLRRDWPRLIAAIQASAILHQYQRGAVESKIMPDLRDYYIAWRASGAAFQHSISSKSDPKVQRVVSIVQEVFLETGEGVAWDQVGAVAGWGRTTTFDWLAAAQKAGGIRREAFGKYVPTSPAESILGDLIFVLPTPEEVAAVEPSLGEGIELIDPITGERLTND